MKKALLNRSILLLAAVMVVAALSFFQTTSASPQASSETRFTELSSSGLSIVPASCPSSPHYSGDCSPSCPSDYSLVNGVCTPPSCPSGYTLVNGQCIITSCSGGQIPIGGVCQCPSGQVLTANGCQSLVCPPGYVAQGGACIKVQCPSGYSLNSFGQCVKDRDINQCTENYWCQGGDLMKEDTSCNSVVSQHCVYGCGGHSCVAAPKLTVWITALPALVRKGATNVSVKWGNNFTKGVSCEVKGDNGDDWKGISGTQTASAINQVTTFVVDCKLTDDSQEATAKARVNVIPVFQEQ